MAYGVLMAAVPPEDIDEYRQSGRSQPLATTDLFTCSHGVAYWVTFQPLGQLLGEAIDRGEPLRSDLWHPLRPPIVVEPTEVRQRLVKLEEAFAGYLNDFGLTESSEDWYVHEIGNVLGVYRLAAASGATVVSVVQPPWDEQRASRVVMPIGAVR